MINRRTKVLRKDTEKKRKEDPYMLFTFRAEEGEGYTMSQSGS